MPADSTLSSSRVVVIVVAPAGPVAGERWIIDLNPRDEQARTWLDSWCAALAPHARAIAAEVGDADPCWAAADAQDAFSADALITTLTLFEPEPRHRSLASLLERPSNARRLRPRIAR